MWTQADVICWFCALDGTWSWWKVVAPCTVKWLTLCENIQPLWTERVRQPTDRHIRFVCVFCHCHRKQMQRWSLVKRRPKDSISMSTGVGLLLQVYSCGSWSMIAWLINSALLTLYSVSRCCYRARCVMPARHILRPSFNIVDRLHAATAVSHEVRWTCYLYAGPSACNALS